MGTGLYAMLPEAMAGEALVDQENSMGGKMAGGRVGNVGSVAYPTTPPSTTTRG